jgi:hypothetical protein
MYRRLVAFVVALVLPSLGFAMLGPTMTLAVQERSIAAALVSGEAVAQHECGSAQSEHAAETLAQAHADSVSDAPELFDGPRNTTAPVATAAAPPHHLSATLAPPCIEGPRRPPRSAATLG